jgi:hypothetical protein
VLGGNQGRRERERQAGRKEGRQARGVRKAGRQRGREGGRGERREGGQIHPHRTTYHDIDHGLLVFLLLLHSPLRRNPPIQPHPLHHLAPRLVLPAPPFALIPHHHQLLMRPRCRKSCNVMSYPRCICRNRLSPHHCGNAPSCHIGGWFFHRPIAPIPHRFRIRVRGWSVDWQLWGEKRNCQS